MATHTVRIHSDGSASPASQHVNNGDTVNFTSDHGAWTITFSGGSPLPRNNYSGAKSASDGGIVSGTAKHTYKYTSCCTPDGGSQTCQDPDIVIDA